MERSLHAADFVFIGMLAFIAGIFAAIYWQYYVQTAFALVISASAWFVYRQQPGLLKCIVYGIASFAFGIFYYHAYSYYSLQQINVPIGKEATVLGVVSNEPKRSDKSLAFVLSLRSPYKANVSLFAPTISNIHYGDMLQVSGLIASSSLPSEDAVIFSPRIRIIAHNKGSWFTAALISTKTRIMETISRLLPPNEASLLSGLLLGDTTGMSALLKDQMELSGTSYVITMYGYKIMLIAFLLFEALNGVVPRRSLFIITATSIMVFTLLSNAVLSAVRAAISVMIGLVAKYAGRMVKVHHVIALSATLMVLFDPTILGGAAFQLSYLSLLGICYLGPPLKKLFRFTDEGFLKWKEHTVMATSANIAIIPVIMNVFGSFSLPSFFSNILIIIPLCIILPIGCVVMLTGFFSSAAAFFMTKAISALLVYQLWIIKLFSWWVILLPALFSSSFALIAYYGVLILIVYYHEPTQT